MYLHNTHHIVPHTYNKHYICTYIRTYTTHTTLPYTSKILLSTVNDIFIEYNIAPFSIQNWQCVKRLQTGIHCTGDTVHEVHTVQGYVHEVHTVQEIHEVHTVQEILYMRCPGFTYLQLQLPGPVCLIP